MLRRARNIVRDAWLVFGLALFGLLLIEAAYRLEHAGRRAIRDAVVRASQPAALAPGYPATFFADSAWWPEFHGEQGELAARWEPFVYWREKPRRGRYINIDSAGLRVTPHYSHPGGARLRVFFFGASTTWGAYERDSATRAADVAKLLSEAGFDPEVTNFGQIAYVSSQELLTLLLELRRGNVPDVVVFWDGVNDVICALENNALGGTCAEADRAGDTEAGATRETSDGTVPTGAAVRSLIGRLSFVQRLVRFLPHRTPPPFPPPEPFCRDLTARWLGEARLLDKLAQAYGFTALAIWQPAWGTSGRPRTAYEQGVLARADQPSGVTPHEIECARLVDSLVAARAARSIITLSSLHARDSGTVFLDMWGHTPERITRIQGDTLTKIILARLPARLRARDRARRSPAR